MKDHDSIEELNRLRMARLEEWQLREKNEPSRPQPVVAVKLVKSMIEAQKENGHAPPGET